MLTRLGLRSRLLAGLLLVVLVLSTGFGIAVYHFVEALEVELIESRLAEQMVAFATAYRADPTTPPPRSHDVRGYAARADALHDLPPWLRSIGPGIHEDVAGDGQVYYVSREDVGDARLYVLLNVAPLERLETQVVLIALISILTAMIVSALAAFGMSRLVLEPVSRLAGRVAQLDPGERGTRIAARSPDREVQLISDAFDRYLERLDAFVAREQAFTGDVSHELRTPLATVLGAAQLLLDDPTVTPVIRARVQRIERAAERMHELIEAMLFLAREQGPQMHVCALDQILRDVVENYREFAEAKGLDLRLSIGASGKVTAPSGMVTSVVGNLVGNAVDHAASGVVDVQLQPGVLTVRDEGPGISATDASQVFERGYRGRGSRGFGLGLALVKRICDHLGWAVEIESGSDRGTLVQVRFAAAS